MGAKNKKQAAANPKTDDKKRPQTKPRPKR